MSSGWIPCPPLPSHADRRYPVFPMPTVRAPCSRRPSRTWPRGTTGRSSARGRATRAISASSSRPSSRSRAFVMCARVLVSCGGCIFCLSQRFSLPLGAASAEEGEHPVNVPPPTLVAASMIALTRRRLGGPWPASIVQKGKQGSSWATARSEEEGAAEGSFIHSFPPPPTLLR